MSTRDKIIPREQVAAWCQTQRALGRKLVWTNGCFDILHAGHVQLLEQARSLGDCLLVGLNADGSVRKLKGSSRPINSQEARAQVLAALGCVDGVCIFEEDTPNTILEDVRPAIHVKGGDYKVEDLPEAGVVQKHGGEVVIVPFLQGFSTTNILRQQNKALCWIVIPARYGSTRFPGKPLAELGEKPVIAHVVEKALQTRAARPVLVATDDERIANAVTERFDEAEVRVVMTSPDCETGTDRIAQAVGNALKEQNSGERVVVVNIQGDEPFINPAHVDALFEAMQADGRLQMATLATPIAEAAQIDDPNVVKVVLGEQGNALYFSRCSLPYVRDPQPEALPRKLRHLGVYAYEAQWLLKMASLKPTPLEKTEKLEQLRALEHGVDIRVLEVNDIVSIAIDTPQDLVAAQEYLQQQ